MVKLCSGGRVAKEVIDAVLFSGGARVAVNRGGDSIVDSGLIPVNFVHIKGHWKELIPS